jgi:cellulose synthase/poly-beta-1,6-N-acetylglucosamine synthase-like glycosyltransferase
MSAAEMCFWAALGLLVYAHLGYPLVLRALVAVYRPDEPHRELTALPKVSLIIAAHDEERVIERKLRDALALDYPRELLEVIVASDGSTDRTVELARAAGADTVLELPRHGKVAALNAAVDGARGEVLAFSDANSFWEPDALRRLVERLADPRVAYVCGQVRFEGGDGNEEGLYWRYEMAVRDLESRLAGITAGNGGINLVRREAYVPLAPERGQDITFPYELTKRGWRAVYEPGAVARERVADTVRDEFGRKRRMMAGVWNTLLRHGILSPRGYGPLYALQIGSHRFLRYVSPMLHIALLAANLVLLGDGALYEWALAAQAAFLAAAALAPVVPLRAFRVARYYTAMTASSLVGLWDYLRRGVPRTWEQARGTR